MISPGPSATATAAQAGGSSDRSRNVGARCALPPRERRSPVKAPIIVTVLFGPAACNGLKSATRPPKACVIWPMRAREDATPVIAIRRRWQHWASRAVPLPSSGLKPDAVTQPESGTAQPVRRLVHPDPLGSQTKPLQTSRPPSKPTLPPGSDRVNYVIFCTNVARKVSYPLRDCSTLARRVRRRASRAVLFAHYHAPGRRGRDISRES